MPLILPRCLRGEALEWLTGLEPDTVQAMNDGLFCWETELLKHFGKSRQQALQEALFLRYRFSNRNSLSISSYFTRKIALLREAGIADQIQLVQHLYDGLEAQLQGYNNQRRDDRSKWRRPYKEGQNQNQNRAFHAVQDDMSAHEEDIDEDAIEPRNDTASESDAPSSSKND
ncbi:predicted protein [Histoplasma mississippiense (nom. inval.)]|uniref:predicted protein n=1 Tax=Ajellomyces capsulatus (strain NAm1 / WU24) TaxID=2059318 RepID=UPI000157D393|nr:predicted protein [Histoplasma mississippiense (nom. inval.)]EDN04527.1 predicted protein [Histoplasma mississippiense (nom. inval.)]